MGERRGGSAGWGKWGHSVAVSTYHTTGREGNATNGTAKPQCTIARHASRGRRVVGWLLACGRGARAWYVLGHARAAPLQNALHLRVQPRVFLDARHKLRRPSVAAATPCRLVGLARGQRMDGGLTQHADAQTHTNRSSHHDFMPYRTRPHPLPARARRHPTPPPAPSHTHPPHPHPHTTHLLQVPTIRVGQPIFRW